MNKEILSLILEFGLKKEEVENLTLENIRAYLNLFHGKSYPTSTLLIYGFDEKDRKYLSKIARNSKFKVVSNPDEYIFSDNNIVAFLYFDNIDPVTLNKANEYQITVLQKGFLEKFNTTFFSDNTQHENKVEFLFDLNVPIEYRIAKPFSNYNKEIKVGSFSFNSDNIYYVNLYKMTCTCKDFQEKQRYQTAVGDIRRLCKHLMFEYKNCMGFVGLSDFNKKIIEAGHSFKKNFRDIKIETLRHPIIINYDTPNEWWNIYFPSETGVYKRYGYSPTDKRFSYDEKPRGFVKPLRAKLEELYKQLTTLSTEENINKKNIEITSSKHSFNQTTTKGSNYQISNKSKNHKNRRKQDNNATIFTLFFITLFMMLFIMC